MEYPAHLIQNTFLPPFIGLNSSLSNINTIYFNYLLFIGYISPFILTQGQDSFPYSSLFYKALSMSYIVCLLLWIKYKQSSVLAQRVQNLLEKTDM